MMIKYWAPPKYREALEIASQFPYIKMVDPTYCDGWRTYFGKPQRCRERALWKYKAGSTKKPHSKGGYFCWYHLLTDGIQKTKYDLQRARRAEKKVRENALQERKATEVSVGQAT